VVSRKRESTLLDEVDRQMNGRSTLRNCSVILI